MTDEEFIAQYMAEHGFQVDFDKQGPALCAVCNTPVVPCGDAGWKHTLGFKARNNCTIPWPGNPVSNDQGDTNAEPTA